MILVPIAYVALWSVGAYFRIPTLTSGLPLPWNPALAFCVAWSLVQAVQQFRRAFRHRRMARETARQADALKLQEGTAQTGAALQTAPA